MLTDRVATIDHTIQPDANQGSSRQTKQVTTGGQTSLHRNALANSRINRLSGGEYQRVALARAIAHYPSVVFVDEPTSALNRELAHGALTVMKDLQQHRANAGITFMITHDETLAEQFCNVIVRMLPRNDEPAGEVVSVTRGERPLSQDNASNSTIATDPDPCQAEAAH